MFILEVPSIRPTPEIRGGIRELPRLHAAYPVSSAGEDQRDNRTEPRARRQKEMATGAGRLRPKHGEVEAMGRWIVRDGSFKARRVDTKTRERTTGASSGLQNTAYVITKDERATAGMNGGRRIPRGKKVGTARGGVRVEKRAMEA